MKKEEIKKRIEKLREAINHHRYLYHVLDRQEISSSALDSLKDELFKLEKQYPEFIVSDSPTQRIGSEPLEKFKKTKHSEPMLSLNDVFSESDIKDWIKRISKLLHNQENFDFFCELKIDGLAFELVYEKGILVTGSTRGDGIIGEDVTENIKTINAIPLSLRKKEEILFDLEKSNLNYKKDLINSAYNSKIIVRGEAFVSKNDFNKLNKIQKEKDLPLYANPRNVAAGSIRQLDSKITASRNLNCFIYDLITDFEIKTHQEKHKLLQIMGFKVNLYDKYCRNIEEVFSFYEKIKKIRENLSYEIDGVIITINDNKIFKKLGVVGKAPRGSVAYKFPLQEATTIIEDIKIQIGRTGVLTPVAYLKPVELAGITVTRATLHNEDEIKRLGIKVGDTVIVGRAGDVIPDIIKVIVEARTGNEKNFIFPKKCPSCNSNLEKIKKGAIIYKCLNKDCPDRKREHFSYFVSKKAFDFSGLGEKIIKKLIEKSVISSPADIFFITKEDLLSLEGFKDKLANNIINAINEKKEISFEKLICSFGIENVGEETAFLLKKNFKSLGDLQNTSLEDLISIKDIGEITTQNIYNWFRKDENIKFIEKLKEAGVKIIKEEEFVDKKLKDKFFVLTGSLNSFTRDNLKRKIESLGGHVLESVSSKINFIIIGNNPGLKLKKARELKIKELTEKDFKELINE